MASKSHNASEDTTVTLKDGTKMRKYRTVDGAIKYEKISEPDDYQKAYEESFVELMNEYPDEATDEEEQKLDEIQNRITVPGIGEMDSLVNQLKKDYGFKWNGKGRPESIWQLLEEGEKQNISQDTIINLLNNIQGK